MKKKLTKYAVLTLLVLFMALANINSQTPTPTPTPRLDPSKIFPPSLEIVRIEPAIPIENQPIRVHFKFSNDDIVRKVRTGSIRGHIFNNSFNYDSDVWKINLQPGQSIEGSLLLSSSSNFKAGKLEIFYAESSSVTPNGVKWDKISSASMDIATLIDVDKDGIDDRTERDLLKRFRPYFKFSKFHDLLNRPKEDEIYRPTDVLWYLTKSELLTSGDEDDKAFIPIETLRTNPNAVLTCDTSKFGKSDLTKMIAPTNYHINPKENVDGESEGNPGRHGNSWNRVLTEKNTGLYGHVVPVRLTDPYNFNFDRVLTGNDQGETYYKIEYWQFFGYNEVNQSYIGNHEGDWTSVQLLVDSKNNIISTFHFAHGVKMEFDFKTGVKFQFIKNGSTKEFTGENCCKPIGFGVGNNPDIDLGIKWAQNHRVRFYKDPQTGEFTHPVVYIENNSHEFFPTEFWNFYGAPNHNGESYEYLTETPPNLGEVESPLSETTSANIILKFNGYWGTFSRLTNPPQGPSLHKNWTYPASSSIRWQIRWSLGF